MIIGLCGRKRHGKTTVANILVEKLGFTLYNFGDALRKMVEALDPLVDYNLRYTELVARVGYENAKSYAETRRLLQRMGTEAGREVLGDDVWVRALEHTLNEQQVGWEQGKRDIVIADLRFPNEKLFIEAAGGKTVRVLRSTSPDMMNDVHESERYADTMVVNYEIANFGTLDDLKLETLRMIARLL